VIRERLARDALRRGEPDDAIAGAREMIVDDACDEAAREVVIRAYLAKGDRASALREYRQLRDNLWKDLEVRPSRDLVALVQDDRFTYLKGDDGNTAIR
jgi:DNA-binding SARP family transcriptional activator